ncbi:MULTISPECIES: hypothetical protein [Moorena]|nr:MULTISPECIES: hypothetical protein [Moorena]
MCYAHATRTAYGLGPSVVRTAWPKAKACATLLEVCHTTVFE